jgi:hypothetical protein
MPQALDPTVVELVNRAFNYRGDVTIERTDGSTVVGYLFNRDIRRVVPVTQLFETASGKEIWLPYSDIQNIRFTGRDSAGTKHSHSQ